MSMRGTSMGGRRLLGRRGAGISRRWRRCRWSRGWDVTAVDKEGQRPVDIARNFELENVAALMEAGKK